MKVDIHDSKLGGYRLTTIYTYEENVRQFIFDIKIKGDIELTRAILSPFALLLKFKFLHYKIVAAPSTLESNTTRGFNHITAIGTSSGLKVEDYFKKIDDWKQSSKSFVERKLIGKHISLIKQPLKNRRYLIVDDIVTSGSTLLACAGLLKKAGVKHIQLLAIANNRRKS